VKESLAYFIHTCCKKILAVENSLPRFAWNGFYSPIPKYIRKSSLLEVFDRECNIDNISDSIKVDPKLLPAYGKYLVIKKPSLHFNQTIELSNVFVTKDGIIFKKGFIHRFSSLFCRISLRTILNSYYEYTLKDEALKLDKATMIPRQFVDQGTFGDYLIELILPLTNSLSNITQPLLIDSDFNDRFGKKDLSHLQVQYMRIPQNGIYVKNLKIITPVQYFDHFNNLNLQRMVKCFPIDSSLPTSLTGRIYLSRSGIKSNNQKQERVLRNEPELEKALSSIGFEIIYPHLMENAPLRAKLSDAHTVVGPAGSAFIHIAWGKPKDIVEIASFECWNPTWVYLSNAVHSLSHTVIMAKDGYIEISKVTDVLRKKKS